MKDKRFKSIVQRVVWLPLMVMVFVEIITIISCCVTFANVERQITDSNKNSLQISQYQLENLMTQIDRTYVQFWNKNDTYKFIASYDSDTPPEEYMNKVTKNALWMEDLEQGHEEIEGVYCYLKNIDMRMYRGASNVLMHNYLEEMLDSADEKGFYNHWKLVDLSGKYYLVNARKFNDYYGGVWIPVKVMEERLGLRESYFRGQTFIMDEDGDTTLDYDISREKKQISIADTKMEVQVGIVFDKIRTYQAVDARLYFLLVLAIFGLGVIPFIVGWLRSKIAEPIKNIDTAMQLIGEGNVDYRINIPNRRTYDEFDRLSERINQTMDEINEISFNLYEAKIKEQKTALRNISQQIRPHFILNALNVIYTYEEDEFPLVKKMVLYLTEYFRYIVNIKREYVELLQEMHHVENYLKIQKERYLDRFFFFVEWETSTEKLLVPPIIIQTFVENCVKYGMNDEGKAQIFVLASIVKDKLKIMIADTGKGFPDKMFELVEGYKQNEEHQEGLGVGFENSIERLKILYGDEASLEIRNAVSGGAVVEIYLPIVEEGNV